MNKVISIFLILLTATGLFLSACASQGNPSELNRTSWKLVSFGPADKQVPAAAGIQTSVEFKPDGTISGNVGCNTFGGNYEIKGGTIVFSMMVSTMMACQGPQMDQENVTLKVMNGTVRYQLQGNSLVIYTADNASAITLSKE